MFRAGIREDLGVRLLVLGGTAFVGHAIVRAALSRGWSVTTFNRGRTGLDPGVSAIRGDRDSADDVSRLVASERWDAVIDCSGYVPRNVLAVTRQLAPVAGRYVFMSATTGWPCCGLA